MTEETNHLIPFLVILSIFSLSISAYLFYQNQQLQQQITRLSVQPSPAPTALPAEASAQVGNWKTYTDKSSRFVFQYPKNTTVEENNGKIFMIVDNYSYPVSIIPDGAHQWGEGMNKDQIDKIFIKSFQYPDDVNRKMYPDAAVQFVIEFPSIEEKNKASYILSKINQILSTFKFL